MEIGYLLLGFIIGLLVGMIIEIEKRIKILKKYKEFIEQAKLMLDTKQRYIELLEKNK